MNMKIAFLSGSLFEDVYMVKLNGFVEFGKENMGRKLKKSIYELKQQSKR